MQRIRARAMQRIRARTCNPCKRLARSAQYSRKDYARISMHHAKDPQDPQDPRAHTQTSLLPNCSERHFRAFRDTLGILLLKKLGHEKVSEKSAISAKNQTTLYFSLSNCRTVYLKKKTQFQQTGGRKA